MDTDGSLKSGYGCTKEGEEMLKSLKPIMIENSKVPVWLSKISPIDVWANSFAIWVWCRGELSEKTKRHETIHFQQQLECLFIFHWILYGLSWIAGYIRYGNGKDAYYNCMFEKEAYDNDQDEAYLETRPRYVWLKYIGRPVL